MKDSTLGEYICANIAHTPHKLAFLIKYATNLKRIEFKLYNLLWLYMILRNEEEFVVDSYSIKRKL